MYLLGGDFLAVEPETADGVVHETNGAGLYRHVGPRIDRELVVSQNRHQCSLDFHHAEPQTCKEMFQMRSSIVRWLPMQFLGPSPKGM
jgi:hypothetical protein